MSRRQSCQRAPCDVPYYSDQPKTWPASAFYTTGNCTNKPRTTTTYDALGRPTAVTAPDGTTTQYLYYIINHVTVDGRNLMALTNIKDANNHITSHLNNSLGQLAMVREVDGVGTTGDPYVGYADTRYYYDVAGNLVKVKQSNASDNDPTTWLAQTTMTYDGFGRKTSMNDPDMGVWTYVYNAAGSLTRQKDAKGQAICFTYDTLNRLLTKAQDSTPADACPGTLPTSGNYHLASYTYDTAANGIGKPHTVSWGPTPDQNKDTFFYDTLGRMYKQDRYLDGRVYTMHTSSYDALHRPLTIVYPDNETVTYTYDREGENSLTAGGAPLVNNITYNGMGQMRILDRAGSIADTTYHYFTSGSSLFRLQTIQHGASGYGDNKPVFNYTYDPVGNILSLSTTYNDGSNRSNSQSFSYDHLNRLLTAAASGTALNANYNHDYTYDKLGNIDLRVADGVTLDYNYSAKPHAVTSVSASSGSGMTLAYDANGNMTRRTEGGVTYDQFFDVENRLILVNPLTGESTGFFYDAAGQRVKTLKPDGAIIYTPYPTYEEEARPTITFQADFESSGQMSEVKSSLFPMSSLWRGSSSTAYPASGAFGYSLSNHAYGHIQSDPIAVSANTQYDLYAYVRGQLDPDDRAGAWIIRARYYNSSGDYISYKDIASGNENSINTTWQEKGGRITTPAGTATLRIQLYNYSNSGWVAFDDVRLNPVGSGTNLVANPGFESSSSWSGIASTAYPGTSLWRGKTGNAAPFSGEYAYSISNLAYGSLRSDAIAVTANTQYDLYAWLRGEIDPDVNTGVSKWIMRVLFYNSSGGYLNYADADSGNPGTLSTNWQQEGGRITTPANTASVRIELFNYLNSGWVAFDDVSFIKVGTGTNLAPNPGFESSGGWSETPSAAFPGTGFVRNTSGIGGPRSGSYGYSISNHAYAYLQSGNLPVTAGAQYDLYAWVRGKLDADDSASNFYIRFRFYDSSGAAIPYHSSHNAYSGSPESLDGTWRYTGGRVTAPANAATAQIQLLSHYNTGWLAFDDVLLTRVGQETVIKRSTYGVAGQTIATRVTNDPVSGNNGLFYIYSDHLGSASLLVNGSNNPVAGSRTWHLPFGGYRPGSAPTQTITDRDFTGQRENMELGLLYYNARYYVPGLGRFASADTIVPSPATPQTFNRYSYVNNRPLTFRDPTGHISCTDSNLPGDDQQDCLATQPPPDPYEPPSDLITHLPLDRDDITTQTGFGPNWYATSHGDCPCYPQSHNIHTGLDFFAPAGSTAYAAVSGTIVAIYSIDAKPNVVIAVTVGEITYYVVHGHVTIDAELKARIEEAQKQDETVQVNAGDTIGTIAEGENHLHLGLRRKTEGQDRAYNPLLFRNFCAIRAKIAQKCTE